MEANNGVNASRPTRRERRKATVRVVIFCCILGKKGEISTISLKFFDPSKPVTVQVDASQSGLGAVLLQEGKPVAYASKALTSAQQAYAQIEKEALALVFGCETFHHYLYGRDFIAETDHMQALGNHNEKTVTNPLR